MSLADQLFPEGEVVGAGVAHSTVVSKASADESTMVGADAPPHAALARGKDDAAGEPTSVAVDGEDSTSFPTGASSDQDFHMATAEEDNALSPSGGDRMSIDGDDEGKDGADDDEEDEGGLFGEGDEEDEGEDEDDAVTKRRSRRPRAGSLGSAASSASTSSSVRQRRAELEYAEEDQEEQEVEERIASATVPIQPFVRSEGAQHWLARLPNFLKYVPTEFDPESYDPENDVGDENLRNNEEASFILRTENTIRWQYITDPNTGEQTKQSNARIIRWSDGSTTLQLGGEQYLIQRRDEGPPPSASSAPGLLKKALQGVASSSETPGGGTPQHSGSARSPMSPGSPMGSPGGLHSFVAISDAHNELLEIEARMAGEMTFLPANLQSESHRKLANAVKQQRSVRTRMSDANERDPELVKAEEEAKFRKNQQAKARAKRKEMAAVRAAHGGGVGGGHRRSRASYGREAIYSDESEGAEGDEDEEGMGVEGVQRRMTRADMRRAGGEYEADDFVVDDADEDEEGPVGYGESAESSEEDGKRSRRARRRRERSEDEMDLGEGDGPRDEIEEADAAIEREARERKKAKKREKEQRMKAKEEGGGDGNNDGRGEGEDRDAEGEDDEDIAGGRKATRRAARFVVESDEE